MDTFYINETLFNGAPENKRNDREMRCYEVLDSLGIAYTRVEHDSAATIEMCLDVEKVLGTEICKNLLLCNSQKTKFYMLLMPGAKPFKTKDLSKQINSARLSFAPAEAMEALVDIHPGSLSVLGLINDKQNEVTLIIDKDLLKDEYIGCHPCENTSTLKIRTEDILNIFLPHVNHAPLFVEL